MKLLLVATLCCAALPAWAAPISIEVFGPDDKPLAGAQLDLRESDTNAPWSRNNTRALTLPIAEKEGVYSFDWDGTLAQPETDEKARRVLWARVSAPGMASQTRIVVAPKTKFALTPGRAWGGVILDRNEKPIAGARVQLNSWLARPEATDFRVFSSDEAGSYRAIDAAWTLEATTDAQGRWQLDELPLSGWASLKVSHSDYARANYSVNLSDESAPPLFLKPGAAVAGQILLPDGSPLVGQKVVAGWNGDSDSETLTDAQGRFRIGGLESGQTFLSARGAGENWARNAEVDGGYLLQQQDMIAVRAGETTDIGQWKARTGALLTMRVVDAATQKPITGARFYSWQIGQSDESDAQGRLKMRVAPDDSSEPSRGSVSAKGYIDYAIVALPKPRNGVIEVEDIPMRRGSVVSGRVRVEGEIEVAELPHLSLQSGGNSETIRFERGADSFETDAIAPGNYRVYAVKTNGNVSKEWEVVSPKTLSVPAPGVAAKAVEVIIRRGAEAGPLPVVINTARGRIVDAQGKGVAGAEITARFVGGDSSTSAHNITDGKGDWRVQTGFDATEFQLLGIERPGYIKSGTAQTVVENGVAMVSGVSLKRRGAPFAGRVLDADGKAASGAWVAVVEARYYAPVRADENGQFELPDVPLEKFALLAARGANWARVEASSENKNVEVKLAPPATFEREAALETALDGNIEWWRAESYWDALGWERMEALSQRDGKSRDWNRHRFALELANREPAVFLQRAPTLIEDLSANYRAEVEVQWRLAQARSGDADARIEVNSWVDTEKAAKKTIDAASVTRLLRAAAVAHELKREDAEDLSDYAAAIAGQIGGGASDEANDWGEIVSELGYGATQRFVDGLKPIPELKAWRGAVVPLAKTGDVAGAKAGLARMETLAATPDWVELTRQKS